MLIVNTAFVSDEELVTLGLVHGSTVQPNAAGNDRFELLKDARITAIERMEASAKALHADAIINVRFSSSTLVEGAYEVIAYGTAVKYKVCNDLQQF